MGMQEKEAIALAMSERSPLIQRVQVRSRQERYPNQTLRRFCTILLTGCLFVALGFVIFLFFGPDLKSSQPQSGEPYLPFKQSYPSNSWPESNGLSFSELQKILLSTPKESKAREWSQYYASGPHLAGKNLSQAEWTRDRWQQFGVSDSSIVAYDVYVNYPKDHRLALLETSKKGKTSVKYEASLEEDVLEKDSTSGLDDRIPTFHGYSASGNVTAQYVYVNYGSFWDFEELVARNVSLEGKIALIKYGGIFRGLKVKRAQELGMIGAVLYSDPGDDGEVTEEHGYKVYPDGPARNPSSVQRGSVEFLGVAAGDPTTPGYPSKPGAPRQPTDDSLPQIPSIPISYEDALPLLKALNGHGPKASSFSEFWQQGGLGYKGVKYNIGPSPPELTLNLVNEQEYVTTPMWNVIGIINGTISDEVIILGNHRDAWIAGGAGDPNSGSAAFNEVIRGFGEALKAGWKPLRTIVLASWDGEEYGLIGSTEWVEEYIPWLSESAVAYLNVDVGAAGPDFKAAAAPLLDHVLVEATHMVHSPNQTTKGQTIGDVWNGHISTIGSGSDFTAFQDFAGIPCIDIGFANAQRSDAAIYHYHSNYDSFDWMDKYGDKGWHYHIAIAKLWAVVASSLIDSPVIKFSATDYAKAFHAYVTQTEMKIAKSKLPDTNIHLEKLGEAVKALTEASTILDAKAAVLEEELEDAKDLQWYRWWKKAELYAEVKKVNSKYKYLERCFIYSNGLDKRNWFKHTVFAPGRWTGYAGAVFPGLVESIEDADVGNLYRWEGIITSQMYEAVKLLKS